MFNAQMTSDHCRTAPVFPEVIIVINADGLMRTNYLANCGFFSNIGAPQSLPPHKIMTAAPRNKEKYINITPTDTSGDLAASFKKLREIENLKENWDGYGSSTISKKVVELAKSVLPDLNKQPRIFPISTGELQLEYNNSAGASLEIIINKDKTLDVYTMDRTGEEYETTTDFSSLKAIIADFYK